MKARKDTTLSTYREKRNVKETGEPEKSKKQQYKKIFVIHKHDASHLHYDFRFEFNKVLKSWAMPKQPLNRVGVKRLALPTEDHPYDYAQFHGTIPEGHYGAGTVEIWDHGTYKNIKYDKGKLVPMSACLKDGHVELWLEGEKLQGPFALIRTHMQGNKKEQWLFFKMQHKKAEDLHLDEDDDE
ncbi:MAG: DNA polymerase ligase N-terminal domain-containing protein [Candidatus Babeliaceae bacterium]